MRNMFVTIIVFTFALIISKVLTDIFGWDRTDALILAALWLLASNATSITFNRDKISFLNEDLSNLKKAMVELTKSSLVMAEAGLDTAENIVNCAKAERLIMKQLQTIRVALRITKG